MSNTERSSNELEYLAAHPDAVQDREMAQTMALAGDKYESTSAKLRDEAIGALAAGNTVKQDESHAVALSIASIGEQPIGLNSVVKEIEKNNEAADQKYADIEEAYPRLVQTKR